MEGRETGKLTKKNVKYIARSFSKNRIPEKEKLAQKFKVKSEHVCKCDDCDLTFLKEYSKAINNKENVLGYIEGTDLKDE